MTIRIIWDVVQLDCYPSQNGNSDVVFTVHWTLQGIDGEHTASTYGSIEILHNDEHTFTPYDQLTKEQVLNWVWQNGVDKEFTEAAVCQQIELKKFPPVVNLPLPWTQLVGAA